MTHDASSGRVDRLKTTLGLCARARALLFGTSLVCDALRRTPKPSLVLLAADASPGTEKKITDKCRFYQIECLRLPFGTDELAHITGKRSLLAAVAITDRHLAEAVRTCFTSYLC